MEQPYSVLIIVSILILAILVRETTSGAIDVEPNCVANCKSFPSICLHGGTCHVLYKCNGGKCACGGLDCTCQENYGGAHCEKLKT